MNIVKLNTENVDRIVPIFDEYRVYFNKTSNTTDAQKFLENNLKNGLSTIFIAEDNDKVIGFVQLYTVLSSLEMSDKLILNDLFLTSEARGQRIGEKLMNKAFEYARSQGYKNISLETHKTNIGGNKLYKKMGMTLDETHNYYSLKL
ncbi:GNAT family N-acetyltransferase [Mammaliicoccus stepanovicii]|uniref:Ribosomal-protein-S18p-alanine acetyltransferase n=1 Tax=Mammaliicoccus stepanovicii TaxID=643214 RepID=A0A239YMM7_9STAP|nr:GNAT family N-acetyltransferase [Mammaliicoccus stepanovicii]PNZ76863.1 GNAT family N-acetyltransferase [Mammaliicoccus stepanovicii]GGI41097.1 N-acetyltransferase [Mammaliicoccus stepanovicii]SNV59656.1 ribosomal-protein-S18p-alanine acetyltransferase [Mammaliicoccus stepanovicii]